MATGLRKLASQTLVYGASTILYKSLNYLLVPYLTRALPDPAFQFGVVGDMYALIPFMLILLTMGLETGYFRFAGKAETEGEKKRLFASAWGIVLLFSCLFLLLAIFFTAPLSRVMLYPDYPQYIWMVALIIALDAVSALPFARLRQEGRPGAYMKFRLISVVVNIIFCVLFLSILPRLADAHGGIWDMLWIPGFGPGYIFAANIIASAVVMALIIPSCGGIRPRVDKKTLRPVMAYSIPLMIAGIPGIANEYIDRQMIKYLMPAGEAIRSVGIFSAVSKVGVALVLFTQMYRLAAEPFFLSGFGKEDFKAMTARAMKYFIIFSIAIFLGIGLFQEVFALIVGPELREGMGILPIIMFSNILAGIVFNLSFWYKNTGATRFAIYVTTTGLIFTIVFNIMLVPRLGILGAALARLTCESAMVLLSYTLNQKYYPIPYDLKRIGEYTLAGVLIFSTLIFTGDLPLAAKYSLNLLLLGAYLYYAVRREKLDVGGVLKSIFKRK